MSRTAVVERTAPQTYLQGIAVPSEAVDPGAFEKLTRRHTLIERQASYSSANPQAQEVFTLRKSDILSEILIRFSGQLTITGGTARTTARWPYDFITARLTANGQSNLINCSGLKLKIRDAMKKADLTDRGVVQTIGNVARSHGTLARSSESWGVGSNTTGLAAGTYDVELEWTVPVAEDMHHLIGSLYLATTSADVTLTLDLQPLSQLVIAETATATALSGQIQVISTKFAIPVSPETGQMVLPDLRLFHSLIETRLSGTVQNGESEHVLVAQGAGKSLLRTFAQVYSGANTASAPLAMTKANFGKLSYRFGNNETPEEFFDGNHMRIDQERRYNVDVGGLWGVFCFDFAHENTFRDVVDLGTTSEFRLVTNLQSGVALTSPRLEYVQETMFGTAGV